jgi:CHAT domain-containing protein
VTVTPCAALWHDAVTQPRPERSRDGVVLVAGPGLPYGAQEVARLARSYRGATRLVGEHAGVAAVLSALDGARLAHVAAHGAFRSDNPLFSCLAMADGPLTVYDLETLGRAPDTLVLSACESGLSGLRPGDELMGLAAALLGLGTRTLIASVVAVPDEQTAGLMLDVHRHLRRGAAPAEALCRAQASTMGSGDVRAIAAAAGFICFGAG